jgi:GTP cyclohydrolase I
MIDVEKTAAAVRELLTALGVDEGDHTTDTPNRVAKAWAEQLAGYDEDPALHLTRQFTAPADPGLVMVSGIRVVSTCAHHLLPIVGTATVAYRPMPGDPVVGLSKLARVVESYARRLQVQERIGWQVANTLQAELGPAGAACIVTASHGCMSLRGIGQPATVTTTHAWAGTWSLGDASDRASVLAEHNRSVAGFKGGPVW